MRSAKVGWIRERRGGHHCCCGGEAQVRVEEAARFLGFIHPADTSSASFWLPRLRQGLARAVAAQDSPQRRWEERKWNPSETVSSRGVEAVLGGLRFTLGIGVTWRDETFNISLTRGNQTFTIWLTYGDSSYLLLSRSEWGRMGRYGGKGRR